MSEVINYLRSNNAEQAKLNQILQTLQKLITPVTGDPKKELIAYAPETRIKTTSELVKGADYVLEDERERRNSSIKKRLPAIQYSYSITESDTGTITFPTTNLKYGSGAEFDSGDFITVASNTVLNVTTFTVSVWFYITGNQTSAKIIEKSSSFSIEMANQQIKASVSGEYTSLYTVTPNAWHNVTITFGSQSLKLYVDNVLKETKTISGTFSSNTNAVKIGEGFAGRLTFVTYSSGVKPSTYVSDIYLSGVYDLTTELATYDLLGTTSGTPTTVSNFVISS